MEEVIARENNPSTIGYESKIICRVCQKQFSQYTCPRCNSRYCSVQCYKGHSLRCTESFMRENVMEELKQVQPDDMAKRKMLDILKRFHTEEGISSEDAESILSEEIIDKVLSGQELKLEDLSPNEIKQFRRAMASGELSKLIQPWIPWWRKPSARLISLSPDGSQLVKPLDELPSTPEDNVREIPAAPETPLPPLRQLIHGEPSSLLAVHLVDVLYSYCFTLRLHNGDWNSDPLGAATVALSVSKVLGEFGRPETVTEVLAGCLEETCSPVFRHSGGFSFGIGLVDDVACLLSLGTNALICSLCDFQRLIQAGERMLELEKMGKTERSEPRRKLRSADRKVYFLMCWVHEQPMETWPALAVVVELEKTSLSQLDHLGKKFKVDRKGTQQSRVLIQES